MTKYAFFIDEHDGSVAINPDMVQFFQEMSQQGLEPRTKIVFGQGHTVTVKSDFGHVQEALADADRT